MKYAGLVRVTIRGLIVIGAVGLALFLIRENFVYGTPHIPFRMFTLIAGVAFAVVSSYVFKQARLELQKLYPKK